MKHRQAGPRAAFTLVELMVAMALIIFIMYILAEAFAAGTAAFRNLRAIGDMNQRLRSAGTTMRRYLLADHFEGRKRLSDADFWKNGPPREGFLRLIQSGASTAEGNDLDGLPSARAFQHALHFAVKQRGNNRGDFFRGSAPAGSPLLSLPFPDSRYQETGSTVVCSPWAEVAIFLRDTGVTTEDIDNPNNVPQPLFTLYLRQRLLLPDNAQVTALGGVPYNAAAVPGYLEISATQDPANPAQFYFNNPQDVTMPARRWGKALALPDTSSTSPGPTNYIDANAYLRLQDEDPTQAGNDVLLSDVLSFHVSVLLPDYAYAAAGVPVDFVDLFSPVATAFASGNPTISAAKASVFDTWSSRGDDVYDYSSWQPGAGVATTGTIPMYSFTDPNNPKNANNGSLISIRAIKLTMRIWDANTKQTRQTSVIVDM